MIAYFVYLLVALILIFVIYLAIKAINRGIKAKNKNLSLKEDISENENYSITHQLHNLNNLYKSGAITEEEYNKAKKKNY